MVATTYEKDFIESISSALKPALAEELAQRAEARKQLKGLQEKQAELSGKVQSLTKEHAEIAETAYTKKEIEKLGKLMQDRGTYKELLNRLEPELFEGTEAVKKIQDRIDSRIKTLMPQLHQAEQAKFASVIDGVYEQFNAYHQAVSKVLADIKIGFISRNKPWTSLSIGKLSEFS